WIRGSDDELLMWIPPEQREYLHYPSTIWISGKRKTIPDISNSVRGPDWATCYT
ncbi:hypothetical protein BGY98DRAFT_926325, partial [Russula aff. rugulosa BPL654]